ncbi:hypothetical protein D3C80_975130 [compost metagenome]
MLQLHGDLRAMFVHPFCQAGQAGNELVGRHPDLIRLGGARREGDGAHTHDQQAGAAGGAGLIVRLDTFAAVTVSFGKVGAHGRHDDTVA